MKHIEFSVNIENTIEKTLDALNEAYRETSDCVIKEKIYIAQIDALNALLESISKFGGLTYEEKEEIEKMINSYEEIKAECKLSINEMEEYRKLSEQGIEW